MKIPSISPFLCGLVAISASAQTEGSVGSYFDRQPPEIKSKLLNETIGEAGNAKLIGFRQTTETNLSIPGMPHEEKREILICKKSGKHLNCSGESTPFLMAAGCFVTIRSQRGDAKMDFIEKLEYPKVGASSIEIIENYAAGRAAVAMKHTHRFEKIISAKEVGWDVPGPVLAYATSIEVSGNGSVINKLKHETYHSTYLNCNLHSFPRNEAYDGLNARGAIKYHVEYEFQGVDGSALKASREVIHRYPK